MAAQAYSALAEILMRLSRKEEPPQSRKAAKEDRRGGEWKENSVPCLFHTQLFSLLFFFAALRLCGRSSLLSNAAAVADLDDVQAALLLARAGPAAGPLV